MVEDLAPSKRSRALLAGRSRLRRSGEKASLVVAIRVVDLGSYLTLRPMSSPDSEVSVVEV